MDAQTAQTAPEDAGEHGDMDKQTQAPECPTHCAQCGRALLWRRPWRHHCESCRPIMRGVDQILAEAQGRDCESAA